MRVLILNPPSAVARNVVRDTLYGCWCKGRRIGGLNPPPMSLVSVATVIREAGHDTRFWDPPAEGKTVEDVAKEDSFDVVVSSTSTMSFREDASVLQAMREKSPGLFTMMFGSHATFRSHETAAHPGVDVAVRREPEFIVRDVLAGLQSGDAWKQVQGITYAQAQNGSEPVITVNPDYPYIENLDDLPIPDRSFLPEGIDYFNPIVKRVPYTTMTTSRGCPAKCSFCTAPTFHGKQARVNSADRILEELERITALGYREIFFRDETFTAYKKRNQRVCEEILSRGLDLTWICNGRVDMIDKETMALMKRAGCHYIKFGVESGVQEILDNIRKGTRVEQAIDAYRWAHEVGIDTHAHFMIGNPGDTKDTVQTTIDHALRLDPTTATFGISTPYPGTPLFDRVAEKHPEIADGSDSNLAQIHLKAFFTDTYCDLTAEELQAFQKRAYRSFFLRPGYIARWVGRMRSIEEIRRLVLAGSNIFSFAIKGDG